MKKVVGSCTLVLLLCVLGWVAVTAFSSPKKVAPYGALKASDKFVSYENARLSGSAITRTRCLQIVKDASGRWNTDTRGISETYECLLNIVSTRTGKNVACEYVAFSLKAGTDKPTVLSAKASPARYCAS